MSHLIAWCRNGADMVPVVSDTPIFHDAFLKADCQALAVPLALYKNPNAWQLSDDYACVSGQLKQILDAGGVLMTSDRRQSQFFALMSAPADEPSMARTGILMRAEANTFYPVTVTIDGQPFLVEMKGCGSPLGRFPNIHLRRQTGCMGKSITKLTGALGREKGHSEFSALEVNRTLLPKLGLPYDVRSLGIIDFEFEGIANSVLLRLVPSSIRASVAEDPVFQPVVTDFVSQDAFRQMGRVSMGLLRQNVPAIHLNMNLNNVLVYESGRASALTDWSSVVPVSTGSTDMDFVKNIFPVNFVKQIWQWPDAKAFFEGLVEDAGASKSAIEAFLSQDAPDRQAFLALNGSVLALEASENAFRDRREHGFDAQYLVRNFSVHRSILPQNYFEMPLTDWVAEWLMPNLEAKLRLLTQYQELSDRHGIAFLNEVLAYSKAPAPVVAARRELDRVWPDLQVVVKPDYGEVELDVFVANQPLVQRWIMPPQDEKALARSREVLIHLIAECDDFIQSGKMAIPSVEDVLLQRVVPNSPVLGVICYPYMFFLTAYWVLENTLLDGVLRSGQYTPLDAPIRSALTAISGRLDLERYLPKVHQLIQGEDQLFWDDLFGIFEPLGITVRTER